jgi:hypothetical protein
VGALEVPPIKGRMILKRFEEVFIIPFLFENRLDKIIYEFLYAVL